MTTQFAGEYAMRSSKAWRDAEFAGMGAQARIAVTALRGPAAGTTSAPIPATSTEKMPPPRPGDEGEKDDGMSVIASDVSLSDIETMRRDLLAEQIASDELEPWDIRFGFGFFQPVDGLRCALCLHNFVAPSMGRGFWADGRPFAYTHRLCWRFARDNGRAPRDEDRASGWEPK